MLKSFQDGTQFTAKDIELLQDEIHVIDEQWNDGAVKEADGSIAPGQAELGDLLSEAHEMVADLLETLPEDEE